MGYPLRSTAVPTKISGTSCGRLNVDYRVLIKPLLCAGEKLLLGNYSGGRKDYLTGTRCGVPEWVLKSRCGSSGGAKPLSKKTAFHPCFSFISSSPFFVFPSFLALFSSFTHRSARLRSSPRVTRSDRLISQPLALPRLLTIDEL